MRLYLVKGIRARNFKILIALVCEESPEEAIRMLKNFELSGTEDIGYWFFDATYLPSLYGSDGVGVYHFEYL